MKKLFELKWEEWDAPIEYVEWECRYCGNVNSGKSTICLKCKKNV